jgi:tRNA(Ile)-lysidine synthase
VSEWLKHFEDSVHARRLLRRGQRILAAVSGGVDSMVLLQVLHELAAANQWRLTIAHLNHQLRGRSSEADERLVRQTAKELKLPVVVRRADVRRLARIQKLSLEMAARKLRHDFLARTAARLNIPAIALAHHADDQLELFFLRLLRGSGGEGLAGMKWRSSSPSDPRLVLVRPLLDQSKAALRDYAAAKGIRFREDASNACLDIQRNRIRHELLPMLRRKYQPALDKTILRVMEIVRAETELVAQAANDWFERQSGLAGAEEVKFEELSMAVQRRCLYVQLLRHGVAPNFDLVEALRLTPRRPVSIGDLLSASKDPGRDELFATRDPAGLLHLHRKEPAGFESDPLRVDLKGRAGEIVFDGLRMTWRRGPGKFLGSPKRKAGTEVFDADKVGSPILLRHWQPGDRFRQLA